MEPSKFKYLEGVVLDKKQAPIERLALIEIAHQLRRIADLMRK